METTLDQLGNRSRFRFKNGRKIYLFNSYNHGYELSYVTYLDEQTAKLYAMPLFKAREILVIPTNW